jgi:hypothetical protein
MGTLLSYGSGIVTCLRSSCLATGVIAERFPGNGSLCWLHSSFFDQTCQNIFHFEVLVEGLVSLSVRKPVLDKLSNKRENVASLASGTFGICK